MHVYTLLHSNVNMSRTQLSNEKVRGTNLLYLNARIRTWFTVKIVGDVGDVRLVIDNFSVKSKH